MTPTRDPDSRRSLATVLLTLCLIGTGLVGCGGSADPPPAAGTPAAATPPKPAAPSIAPAARIAAAEGETPMVMEPVEGEETPPEKAPPPPFQPTAISFTEKGGLLVGIGETPDQVLLHDVATGQIARQIPRQPGPITTAVYDPDTLWGATGAGSGEIQLWSLARPKLGLDEFAAQAMGGTSLPPLLGHAGPIHALALHGPTNQLASGGADGVVRFWRLMRPRLASSSEQQGVATSALLSADGKTLFVGDQAGTIGLWSVETLESLGQLDAEKEAIVALLLSKDAKSLIAGDRGGGVHVWDIESRKPVATIAAHRAPVTGLAFREDGRELYTVGADQRLRSWQFPLETLIQSPKLPLEGALTVAGSEFVTVMLPDKLSVHAASGGRELRTIPTSGEKPLTAAANARGDVVASVARDGRLSVLQTVQGRILCELLPLGRGFKQVSVSPEGDSLIALQVDGPAATLRIPATSPQPLKTPAARRLARIPGQGTFLTGGSDGKILEWESATGRTMGPIGSVPGAVACLVAAPVGERVAAASEAKVFVWSRRGERWTGPATLEATERIKGLEWSADGESLTAALAGGALQILGMESPATQLETASEVVDAQKGRLAVIEGNRLWIHEAGETRPAIESRDARFTALRVSPQDGTVAVAEASGAIRLIPSAEGPEATFAGPEPGTVSAMRFSPDGRQLVVGTAEGRLGVFDLDDPARPAWKAPEVSIAAFSVSPNGRYAGYALETGDVRIVDRTTGQTVQEWKKPVGDPLDLAWSPEGRVVAVAGQDGPVEVRNVETGTLIGKQTDKVGRRLAIAMAEGSAGLELVSVFADGRVELWQPGKAAPVRSPLVDAQKLQSAVLSETAGHGLLKTVEGALLLLSRTGAEMKIADVAPTAGAFALSSDGRSIAWVEERRVQIVSLKDQSTRTTIESPGDVKQVQFVDGRRVSVLDAAGQLNVYSTAGPRLETVGSDVAIDGLLRAERDGNRMLVQTGQGDRLLPVRVRHWATAPGQAVRDVCLLSQEQRVLCCREDGTLDGFDLATGTVKAEGLPGRFRACAAAPEGDVFLAGDEGVQRRKTGGKTLEPVALDWKGGPVRLVEQGRNVAALTEQGAFLIQDRGSVETLGTGPVLALSHGRPVVRSEGQVRVQSRAVQSGPIAGAAKDAQWICSGPANQQFALTKTGDLYRIDLAKSSAAVETQLGGTPIGLVRDAAKSQLLIGLASGEIVQWNWETKQRTTLAQIGEPIISLAFEPSSRLLAIGAAKAIHLLFEDRGFTMRLPAAGSVAGLSILGAGKLAIVHDASDAELLDLPQLELLPVSSQDISAVSAERAGSFAWCGKDGKVRLTIFTPRPAEVVFEGARGNVVGLFLTGQDQIYAIGSSGEVTSWDRGAPLAKRQEWSIGLRFKKVFVDRASSRAVLASATGGGLILDLATRLPLDELPQNGGDPLAFSDLNHVTVVTAETIGQFPINARKTFDCGTKETRGLMTVSGSPDLFVASVGNPNGITRCEIAGGTLTPALPLRGGAERTAAIEGDPARIVAVSKVGDGKSAIVVADVLTGKEVWRRVIGEEITWVSGNRREVLVAARSGVVLLLETATGDVRQAIPSESPQAVFRLPGREALAIVTQTGRVVTTEINSFKSLHAGDKGITALAFSPNGEFAATGDETGAVAYWNLAKGVEIARSDELQGAISALRFDPTGLRLFAGSLGGQAAAWSLAEAKPGEKLPPARIVTHPFPVRAITSSKAGDRLITAADDNLVRVWDLGTGFEVEQYAGHASVPVSLQLAPDKEDQIVSYDATGSLRRWTRPVIEPAPAPVTPPPEEEIDESAPPPPPPPPVRVEVSIDAIIAVKAAAPPESGTPVPAPPADEGRPIQLASAMGSRAASPEMAVRNSIGSQLDETVSALRKEADPARKEDLRAKTSALLERLNAIPRTGPPDESADENSQVQAEGEGSLPAVPLELVIGEERFASPLAAQQVVAIHTSYNFSAGLFRPVKMCVTSDGKTVLSLQPGIPGQVPAPPQIPDEASATTRAAILRNYEDGLLRATQGVVEAWDIATRVRLRRWTQVRSLDVSALDLAANESTLFTLPDLFAFDLVTGEHRELARRSVFAMSPTSTNPLAAIAPPGTPGATSELLALYDGQTLKPLNPRIEGFESFISAMAIAPDGKRLIASIRERQRHRLVELEPGTLKEVAVLETVPHGSSWTSDEWYAGITRIVFLDAGSRFITYGQMGDENYNFNLWDGRKITSKNSSESPLIEQDFIRGVWPIAGTDLVATRSGTSIQVYDVKKLKKQFQIDSHKVHFGRPETAISADGVWLATGDDGGNAALWHLPTGLGPLMFRPQMGPIVGLNFSKSGQYLSTIGEENRLRVWKLAYPEIARLRGFYEIHKQKILKTRM